MELLKNLVDDRKLKESRSKIDFSNDPNSVKVYSESDDYQCLHNNCDI